MKNFKKIQQAAITSLKKPGSSKRKLPHGESSIDPILYVFRHGESFDNKRRIFSGRRNSQLTAEGIKQANALAKKLKNKKIDLGISPNLDRCRRTLTIILKNHPQAKKITDHRLLERSYGNLTGKSKLKMMKIDPILTIKYRRDYNFPPPGGESLKMVQQRVFPFCKDLIQKMKKEKINVAVSCTNNTMRIIRMFFEKLTVLEMQTLENPLGKDYASYVIKSPRWS